MSQPLHSGRHPGAHPDADQINTFVEGAASAHQRSEMLAHLAECGECRELVFLLQGQAEPEPAAATLLVERKPRRWFFPLGLAGAALACGVTALVYLEMHRSQPERPAQMATTESVPAPPVAAPPVNQPEAPERKQPKDEVRPRQRAEVQGPRGSGGAATRTNAIEQLEAAPPPQPVAQPSPAAPAAGSASSPAPVVVAPAPAAKASPAPATETAQAGLKMEPANEPSVQVTGRNFAALAMVTPTAGLRIEHDSGPADGRSEVAGRVTDMAGAVIPGAAVVLRDAAGATRQTTTGGDGRFNLAGVTPGHYTLSVTARGFEHVEQTMNLQARDVARLETVLPVGASSQTVEVAAEQNSLQTEASDAAAVIEGELPSRMPATERVAKGKRVLSIDGAGTLFLSHNGGKSWKKVKPEWNGKVIQIAVAGQAPEASAEMEVKRKSNASGGAQVFEITTDSGTVWTSDDGIHWRRRQG